jgi:putative ABC transport system permease protein
VLPLAYQEQIRRLPGVKDVTVANWFGGIYVDQSNFFAQFAVNADRYFRMFPELAIDPEQLRAFQREKTAAVAGAALARRFNWKLGDHITLRGTYLPADAELTLAGTFTSPNPYDETTLLFHYDYLYELMGRRGQAGAFCVLADSRESLPRIAKTIDDTYASSTAPTKTETEKAFQQSFGAMLGNVKLLIRSISVVVVFTILLVTAASMGMSIRERPPRWES